MSTNCSGGEKCLYCNVRPEACATINRAQEKSLKSVIVGKVGKVKAPEALKNMAQRYPGKAGKGPYDR